MRQNDRQERCYFRSSGRVLRMNGAWYFATREGEEGPYPTEQEAEIEVARFIIEKTELACFQREREAKRKTGHQLELVALDSRPRIRPVEPVVQKHRVYI